MMSRITKGIGASLIAILIVATTVLSAPAQAVVAGSQGCFEDPKGFVETHPEGNLPLIRVGENSYAVPRKLVEAEHQRQIDEYLRQSQEGIGQLSRIETKTVFGPDRTQPVTRRAGNQPSQGTRFTTPGSGFIWADSGNNVSVSLGVTTWGASISATFTTGRTGSLGFSHVIPNSQVNRFVHLYITRDFEIREWTVYWRPFESNGPWSVYGRMFTRAPVSLTFSSRLA